MSSGSKKMILDIDQGIVDLAFALTPKYYKLKRQAFRAHISVVRNEWFVSANWGMHEGEIVEFTYDPRTINDETYHWMRAWSDRLSQIRLELGRPAFRHGVTLPPDGELCFHITVGNTKPENLPPKPSKKTR
jgi:hypothetical protein